MLRRSATLLLLAFVCAIPVDAWGAADSGSAAAWIGLLLVGAGTLAVLADPRVRRLSSPHWLLLAFVLWACASLTWSQDVDTTWRRVLTYWQSLVFLLLFWELVRTPADAVDSMVAYVAGAGLAAGATLAAFLRGEEFRDEARYAAGGYDPNDLGVTLAIGIPLAWLVVTRAGGWRRWLAVGYLPLALVAVALTASRGAGLTTLAALTAVPALLSRGRGRARAAALLVLVSGLAALAALVPATSWERLLTVREQVTGGTMTHRTLIWSAGWQVFLANWLAGVGAGAYGAAVEPVLHWNVAAHSTPLSVLAELGVVGALLFGAPFVVVLARARRAGGPVRAVTYVLLATWLVGVASLTWEYRKATWFVLALLVHLTSPAGLGVAPAPDAAAEDGPPPPEVPLPAHGAAR